MNHSNMNHDSLSNDERLVDLMIQRATTGISESEENDLAQLSGMTNNSDEPERFEQVAAATAIAMSQEESDLPDDLRDRILVSAGKHFGSGSGQNDFENLPSTSPANLDSKIAKGMKFREAFAYAVAAASLLFLLTGYNPFALSQNRAPAVATVAQRMERFVSSDPSDLVDIAWTPVDEKQAGGRIIWSDKQQQGYMVFRGLPVNDPAVEQYQLWIFDKDPAQEVPVDGGVFDIAASRNKNGETIVPINAHVPVEKAVQFAVTVEKPGGVMKSKRERIPVLATL